MKRYKLLIADDDKLVHEMFSDALTGQYDIIHAYDGEEALRTAREDIPDLILLDVLMPSMDGREVCRIIKGTPETAHVKILMVSARDSQFDRLVGLEVGADDYVEKPVTAMELRSFVRKMLEKP